MIVANNSAEADVTADRRDRDRRTATFADMDRVMRSF